MVIINRFKRLQALNKSHEFTFVTIAPVVPGHFVKFVQTKKDLLLASTFVIKRHGAQTGQKNKYWKNYRLRYSHICTVDDRG